MRSNNRDPPPLLDAHASASSQSYQQFYSPNIISKTRLQYVLIFFNFVQKSMTSFPCIYSVFEIIGPLLCFMFVLYSSNSLAKWEKHRGTL